MKKWENGKKWGMGKKCGHFFPFPIFSAHIKSDKKRI
jgi:hypothetical protein